MAQGAAGRPASTLPTCAACSQLRDTRKKITTAVRASGTTLPELFGIGKVIATIVIGDVSPPGRDSSECGVGPVGFAGHGRSRPRTDRQA